MLMKEIEDDTHRWKRYICSWIGRINIVKMTILPKAIYRFLAIPIKLPMAFFIEQEENIFFNFHGNTKDPEQTKLFQERKMQIEESEPCLQTILKATVIKIIWYWHRNRNVDQWNRIESPEINHAPKVNLSTTKEARIYKGEKTASSISGTGKTGKLLYM